MKARYVGRADTPDENPRFVTFGGVSFRRETWTAIDGIDPRSLIKLKVNPTFEYSDDDLTADEIAEAASVGMDPASTVVEPDSTDGLTKVAILERLSKFPDANYDARWGVPKLRAALESAEFEFGEQD